MTTNLSIEKIEDILNDLNRSDPNIQIKWEGGKKVDYLDVTISTEIPRLKTTIFRKLAAQPYVLPFSSAHPIHTMRNIPYAALRAVRICSDRNELKNELEQIRVHLMLNKYPPKFIDQHIKRLYKDLTGVETSENLMNNKHEIYRRKALENQLNSNRNKLDFNNSVICHFSYTPELARFGMNFHEIWNEIFSETPFNDKRVIYANRTTENLKQMLVKKRPKME